MLQFITHTSDGLEEVLEGGCRWVQLRIKNASDEEYVSVARIVGEMCRRFEAVFIVDDRVHLVETVGADGVHLGKNDMPVNGARSILGMDKIIGATANSFSDICQAAQQGADYIGLGPFRFTTTKENLSPILGLEGYERIISRCRASELNLPIIAIGGITLDDITEIKRTGVDGIAISGLILNASNKKSITEKIIQSWTNS